MTMRSLTVPPAEAASGARLRYVSDRDPGIARVRAGRGFADRIARGRANNEERALLRLLDHTRLRQPSA
jgi:DNA topoisomerase I